MVTRAVGDRFGTGGIADRYIRLGGYPFLDAEDHAFGVPGLYHPELKFWSNLSCPCSVTRYAKGYERHLCLWYAIL